MKQHLAIGQKVTVVGSDKKTFQGEIAQVVNEDVARIDYDNGSVVASFSEEKTPGTFHFEQASPRAESGKHEAHNQHKKE